MSNQLALFGGNDLILLDGVTVDAKTGEFHSFGAQPTQYAIESGAAAADHIVELPDVLEVTFVMSNLDEPGSSYGNRAAVALGSLRGAIKSRSLFQVVTRHRLYESMAITAVRAEHVGPFSGGLRGSISFQHVPVAPLEKVTLPASRTRRPGAATQVNAGRKEAREPTAEERKQAGKRSSVLSQIFR